MKGCAGCILLAVLMLLTSCSNEPVRLNVVPDVVEKGDTARRTLLVYMMAENSLDKHAGYDLEEIAAVAGSVPRDCRLFVYVDGASFPTMYQYFALTDGNAGSSVFHLFDHDVCSSDTTTLGVVLDYILENYPTEKLDLVMWSHGDGWIRGPQNSAPQRSIGIDNGNNSFGNDGARAIEVEELAALLERLSLKVDRLVFDACFMQCVEVIYALRNAANWVVASPAEIPGNGADYSTLVPAFFMNDSPVGLVDAYLDAYEGEFAGAVLSVARPSAATAFADAMYYYVNRYFAKEKKRDYVDVAAYLPGGKYNAVKAYPSYYDINAVMRKYLTVDEYEAWHEAFDLLVPYSKASARWYSSVLGHVLEYDSARCCGVSVYLPQNSGYQQRFNDEFKTTEWYSAAGWQAAGW